MESLAIILQIIQIIHLQFRQETSGSVHLLPVHLPKAPGSPASVISPSASTCILANSEGQPSQVAKSRRLTHSPPSFGCDQSHNCPVHILTSPPGEGVLQLQFFKNRFEESTPHRHIKLKKPSGVTHSAMPLTGIWSLHYWWPQFLVGRAAKLRNWKSSNFILESEYFVQMV